MVNALINAYGLFKHLKIVSPLMADDKLLRLFHSQEYINELKRCSNENEDEEKLLEEGNSDDFGLGYDCPLIENVYEHCCSIAGASITAAHLINLDKFKYVVNWFGGWHHGKRDKASGFCYINDIALCILKLRQRYNRVLYVDLDQHHGDGVQEAFEYTNKVMTMSFHKYMPGFFPGTGSLDDCGKGNGMYYSLNIPLHSGVDDETFATLFAKLFTQTVAAYRPEALVIQCGADSLHNDPIDQKNPFNLTLNGYLKCIRTVMDTDLPAVFLGGGGYHFANTSRLWCSIVALLTEQKLEKDIPEHDYFLSYSPDYELAMSSGLIRNKNSNEYLDKVSERIADYLKHVKVE